MAKSKNIPVVIDADGLFVLSKDTSFVQGYEKCILTPNLIEFQRLYEASVRNCYTVFHRNKYLIINGF